MSNFLTNVINRHLGKTQEARPRLRGRFEPQGLAHPAVSALSSLEEKEAFKGAETTAQPSSESDLEDNATAISPPFLKTQIPDTPFFDKKTDTPSFLSRTFVSKPNPMTFATESLHTTPLMMKQAGTLEKRPSLVAERKKQPATINVLTGSQKENTSKSFPVSSSMPLVETIQKAETSPPSGILNPKPKTKFVLPHSDKMSNNVKPIISKSEKVEKIAYPLLTKSESDNQININNPSFHTKAISSNSKTAFTNFSTQYILPTLPPLFEKKSAPKSANQQPSAAPTVKIHIGRIEVKAVSPNPISKQRKPVKKQKPKMSLDQFLNKA